MTYILTAVIDTEGGEPTDTGAFVLGEFDTVDAAENYACHLESISPEPPEHDVVPVKSTLFDMETPIDNESILVARKREITMAIAADIDKVERANRKARSNGSGRRSTAKPMAIADKIVERFGFNKPFGKLHEIVVRASCYAWGKRDVYGATEKAMLEVLEI